MLNGNFLDTKEESEYFHYSKDNVQPFFTPDWVKDGIIYQIFTDRFYDGSKDNNPDFKEWYYDGLNIPPEDGKLLKKYTSENGKILPSRITSVSLKKQRELSLSIKRARNLALI